MEKERTYIAIDLKSFYASVECALRNLDPLKTNLVVADISRTEKTICLAVSPSLKKYGIPGRARLFEVVEAVKKINAERLTKAPGRRFTGKSCDADELEANPSLELDFIAAKPQMRHYMQCSAAVVDIYLKYISMDDMHVYSVDEVFMDVTAYLKLYGKSPKDLAMTMIKHVLKETGITATAGIGPNMYLCKIAMDVEAKHIPADENGVRIAELTEQSYREKYWSHRPITDFWRVGPGIAKRLAQNGMYTMGDIARCSVGKMNDIHNEDLLYRLFGVNAELLIDHAWGWEPCTISDIKNARPKSRSISQGQVLSTPYSFEEGKLIIKEMADLLALDLTRKKVRTSQIVLNVGYDIDSLKYADMKYEGEFSVDRYGRVVPKQAHGSINLEYRTSASSQIVEAAATLYEQIVDRDLHVRRMSIAAEDVISERAVEKEPVEEQLNLFTDYEATVKQREESFSAIEEENELQKAVLNIKEKYGKNSILRGMNFEEAGTTRERNGMVGGHKE